MTQYERLELLAELGRYLSEPPDEELKAVILQAYAANRWFTPENIHYALAAIGESYLQKEKLKAWAERYSIPDVPHPERNVALIMAGNIPLVGFHDWLCTFVAGHRAVVKLSEKDRYLLPFLVKKMGDWAFESWEYTYFLEEGELLRDFDAVIATGSNNTARYFEYYFSKYPRIIRSNRNSVAVLTGYEEDDDLRALGRDIFTYFGLGCRNVSKLYVPHGYRFDRLLSILAENRDLLLHDKYKNNYDYTLALFLLNRTPHLNNGCLLLREESSLQARIASVHYEYYDELFDLDERLVEQKRNIQCVVSKVRLHDFVSVPFGKSQQPALDDYADGIDTMAFLRQLYGLSEQ
ncbi:MAG: acyl-CoA reductase [Saprospiraceae bacterium]|nr:acyl-CoA reductase [Saprospiraceae bacterium]MDW8484461.1 acyl-CoA reductase [Saprospiraceae bacterium]